MSRFALPVAAWVADPPAGKRRFEFKSRPAGVYRILVEDKGKTTALGLVVP